MRVKFIPCLLSMIWTPNLSQLPNHRFYLCRACCLQIYKISECRISLLTRNAIKDRIEYATNSRTNEAFLQICTEPSGKMLQRTPVDFFDVRYSHEKLYTSCALHARLWATKSLCALDVDPLIPGQNQVTNFRGKARDQRFGRIKLKTECFKLGWKQSIIFMWTNHRPTKSHSRNIVKFQRRGQPWDNES